MSEPSEQLTSRFREPVVGPSYRRSAQAVAVALTLFVVGALLAAIAHVGTGDWATLAFIVAVGAMMVANCWYIVFGKTTVDSTGVHQDWFTTKSYPWQAIHAARVLRLPFATRLVISAGRGPYRAAHAGSAELERAFDEIAAQYQPTVRR